MISKRVLITGISGFIGQHLARRLVRDGFEVYGIDNTILAKKDVQVMVCDITDREKLAQIVKDVNPGLIIHLAGFSDPSRNNNLMEKAMKINLDGTINIIDACDKIDYEVFVNICTSDVYFGNKVPFKEDIILNPVSPYAISKYKAEGYAKEHAIKYDRNIITLRPALVYGPGQKDNKFLSQAINNIIKEKEMETTRCEQKRDYIYVEDLIDAIVKILSLKDKSIIKGQVINIGSGKQHQLKEIIHLVERISGKKAKIKETKPYRENELFDYMLSIDKAWKLIGWLPKISIEEGIKRTVENEI